MSRRTVTIQGEELMPAEVIGLGRGLCRVLVHREGEVPQAVDKMLRLQLEDVNLEQAVFVRCHIPRNIFEKVIKEEKGARMRWRLIRIVSDQPEWSGVDGAYLGVLKNIPATIGC